MTSRFSVASFSDSRGGPEDQPYQVDQGYSSGFCDRAKPALTICQQGASIALAQQCLGATQERLMVQYTYSQGLSAPSSAVPQGWMALAGGLQQGELHLTVVYSSPSWDNRKCPTLWEGGWQLSVPGRTCIFCVPCRGQAIPSEAVALTTALQQQ